MAYAVFECDPEPELIAVCASYKTAKWLSEQNYPIVYTIEEVPYRPKEYRYKGQPKAEE